MLLTLNAPLIGADDEVKEAIRFRNKVRERLIHGLSQMGADAASWIEELQGALDLLTDAKWWRAQKTSFEWVDDDTLVKIVAFQMPLGNLSQNIAQTRNGNLMFQLKGISSTDPRKV